MASIYIRWVEAFKRYGVRGVYERYVELVTEADYRRTCDTYRCTAMGTVKFGRFVGEDHLGNKYYEDLDEKHGQHR